MFILTTQAATIGAIVLFVVLISWILWARVFSIPWEVRRMRKLAKTIEKDETYTLSRKDYKRFHQKGVILESKMDSAMSPIGVAATAAMIPAVEEVEEVTATEEDIMGELDKIPGLGPEEKAVLAEEMRKIPRKDRIWFLDDLKRQMGMRRMDFLTQREAPVEPPPTPKPVPEPKVEPEPKPTRKPKPKAKPKAPDKAETPAEPVVPLEEVKPEEPPAPDKALTEDRTAPTVLPSEMEPLKVPSGVEIEIRRELEKIPGLSEEERQALIDHLKYLSKEERQATYNSLRQTADMDD
jgi:outer membrane biosynthesis protein TonB